MSSEDSLVRCQVNCDDRFMLSLTRKFGAPHLLVQLLVHARLCMTQSVHLRPIVPLTLPSSLHTAMLPTLASRPSWHQISILHFWTMISTIISLQFRLLADQNPGKHGVHPAGTRGLPPHRGFYGGFGGHFRGRREAKAEGDAEPRDERSYGHGKEGSYGKAAHPGPGKSGDFRLTLPILYIIC